MINDKVYLITAPSGTGKTTQYKNLKELYKEEIRIINGDKPCLEFREDGNIYVYTSPWKGKEKYSSQLSGRLDGVIYLSQSNENCIRKLSPGKAVLPVFTQFLYSAESERNIRAVCRMADRLLNLVNVWHLKNLGDLDSSRLLYQTVFDNKGNSDEKI